LSSAREVTMQSRWAWRVVTPLGMVDVELVEV
jgi:hypothetical protein